MTDARVVGERIAYHRKRLNLSQVDLAGLIGRSESWVSQVERGVRSVDRISVLQKVADTLSVSVAELRGADTTDEPAEDRSEAFETLRLALTGHPVIRSVITAESTPVTAKRLSEILKRKVPVWEMVHAGRYTELAPVLSNLITDLELAVRHAPDEELRKQARHALTDTYQAAAAMMAKLSENDAAWIAADRAAFNAENLGLPLEVAASLFRMAHVFLSLRQISQAYQVGSTVADALAQKIEQDADPKVLSLYGAFQLVLAIAAARENERAQAHEHLDKARKTAERLGSDRNDFGTEFGPTNVGIHAVAVAVELGDAGQALDLAEHIDTSKMSPERQARFLIDVAQAHAMRRHIGDALHALQEAEQLTPEQTRTHKVARDVARDLIQRSGTRARPELRDLAERFGVLP
ncbi:transcriptional regulator [Planobispora rosea]|uniref:Transcriptional regulator n=1 Tax=Planobispora rosea TaxID=35762 RepID=A0A8J3SE98_PLARO|nr:helix-turn-helix transcriptional regulator [Planobispora rosea]GGT00097.1 transcriptional regulator [Planobispora rosea]GIH88138.1 transcriptional regulator [Planobispora rosea]